jgi:hypothetical protein
VKQFCFFIKEKFQSNTDKECVLSQAQGGCGSNDRNGVAWHSAPTPAGGHMEARTPQLLSLKFTLGRTQSGLIRLEASFKCEIVTLLKLQVGLSEFKGDSNEGRS